MTFLLSQVPKLSLYRLCLLVWSGLCLLLLLRLLLFSLILLGFTALHRVLRTMVIEDFLLYPCLSFLLSALLLLPLSVPLQFGFTYCLAHVDLIMQSHDVVLEEEDLSLNDWISIVLFL